MTKPNNFPAIINAAEQIERTLSHNAYQRARRRAADDLIFLHDDEFQRLLNFWLSKSPDYKPSLRGRKPGYKVPKTNTGG